MSLTRGRFKSLLPKEGGNSAAEATAQAKQMEKMKEMEEKMKALHAKEKELESRAKAMEREIANKVAQAVKDTPAPAPVIQYVTSTPSPPDVSDNGPTTSAVPGMGGPARVDSFPTSHPFHQNVIGNNTPTVSQPGTPGIGKRGVVATTTTISRPTTSTATTGAVPEPVAKAAPTPTPVAGGAKGKEGKGKSVVAKEVSQAQAQAVPLVQPTPSVHPEPKTEVPGDQSTSSSLTPTLQEMSNPASSAVSAATVIKKKAEPLVKVSAKPPAKAGKAGGADGAEAALKTAMFLNQAQLHEIDEKLKLLKKKEDELHQRQANVENEVSVKLKSALTVAMEARERSSGGGTARDTARG